MMVGSPSRRKPLLPAHPWFGPCMSLPGKRENRENLLRERRRGGGDATDGERGGVTAEGRGMVERGGERETSWFIWLSSFQPKACPSLWAHPQWA